MRRFRLSIAGLMSAILLSALGIAALARPSLLWASTLFTLLVAALLTVTLASLVSRSPGLKGFMVFGWGWFALINQAIPMPDSLVVLLTRTILDGFSLLSNEVNDPFSIKYHKTLNLLDQTFLLKFNQFYALQIVCLLSVPMIGFLGVFLARWMSAFLPNADLPAKV